MESAIAFIFYIVILLFSVVIHEVSHGAVAYALGDSTAKYAGRLTLNPIPHIDLFGSVILPLMLALPALFGMPTIIFGWAKPVPFNPYNLKNQKWGPALVGAAGPGVNFLIAILFGLAIRFGSAIPEIASGFAANMADIFSFIVLVNIVLAVFNLVPIPPLDGSKMLFSVMPYSWYRVREFLERNGFLILLIFIFFFMPLLSPVVNSFFSLITGSRFF